MWRAKRKGQSAKAAQVCASDNMTLRRKKHCGSSQMMGIAGDESGGGGGDGKARHRVLRAEDLFGAALCIHATLHSSKAIT